MHCNKVLDNVDAVGFIWYWIIIKKNFKFKLKHLNGFDTFKHVSETVTKDNYMYEMQLTF